MKYCQQTNLTIKHDWSKTQSAFSELLALASDNGEHYGNSLHFPIQNLGMVSKHKLSPGWIRIAGPAINKTMPWLPSLLSEMKELCPDDSCISRLQGDGARHVDLKTAPSALNFIFANNDPEAYTVAGEERYPSVVDTAWILDTQQPHAIINKGERWTLSIHFKVPYNVVQEWFNAHPNLIFGASQGTI